MTIDSQNSRIVGIPPRTPYHAKFAQTHFVSLESKQHSSKKNPSNINISDMGTSAAVYTSKSHVSRRQKFQGGQ